MSVKKCQLVALSLSSFDKWVLSKLIPSSLSSLSSPSVYTILSDSEIENCYKFTFMKPLGNLSILFTSVPQ